MNTAFTNSFLRDVRKLPDDGIRDQVRNAVLTAEAAPDVRSIPNLKKLSGGGSCYRIRLGDYRIGLSIQDDLITFYPCSAAQGDLPLLPVTGGYERV